MLKTHDVTTGRIISHCDLTQAEIDELSVLMEAWTKALKLLYIANQRLSERGYITVTGNGDCVIVKENSDLE